VSGEITESPIYIQFGMLFEKPMNLKEGFLGFSFSEKLQKNELQAKVEQTTTEFIVTKKMMLSKDNDDRE
jgi:hypothetical protein